jgi:hypothetical protein
MVPERVTGKQVFFAESRPRGLSLATVFPFDSIDTLIAFGLIMAVVSLLITILVKLM